MTRVQVDGVRELRRVAYLMRQAAIRQLRRELNAATRIAVRPLEREIKASAARMLPKRGGYAGIMSRAVKVTTHRRGMDFYAIIYARGKKDLRDVRAVDLGRLKHPVFGRWRHRVPPTLVPRGFVMIPVRKLEDRIVSENLDALQRIVIEIARG